MLGKIGVQRPAGQRCLDGHLQAIQWDAHDGGELPLGHNWLSATAVFSSIASRERRQAVADRIWKSLPAGGYLFYFDFRRANAFAGGDEIDARAIFRGFNLVWSRRLGRFSSFPLIDRVEGLITSGFAGDGRRASFRELVGDALVPSQEALLLRKA